MSSHAEPLGDVAVIGRHYPALLAARTLDEVGFRVVLIMPPTGHALQEFPAISSALLPESIRRHKWELASPGGARRLRATLSRVDVALCAISREAVVRLGVDQDSLGASAVSAPIVYLHGVPENVPDTSGHDVGYQAASGLVELSAGHGIPQVPVADISLAAGAVIGVLLAVLEARSGRAPTAREVNAYEAVRWGLTYAVERDAAGNPRLPSRDPGYGVYPTADGAVAVAIWHNDSQWAALCDEIGLAHLAQLGAADRIRDRAAVMDNMRRCLAKFTTDELMERLVHAGVPCTAAGPAPQSAADLVPAPVRSARRRVMRVACRADQKAQAAAASRPRPKELGDHRD